MPKSYVPPHLRVKVQKVEKVKAEKPPTDISNFPELGVSKPVEESKMDFSRLFKNVINSTKKKPMKKGLILLTKTHIVDSLTPEERLEEDQYWESLKRERHLWNCVVRLEKDKNERREYDLNYISEEEIVQSESEEEVEEDDYEEEEDDDVEEDELEDEF
jgi:quinolinate synthase